TRAAEPARSSTGDLFVHSFGSSVPRWPRPAQPGGVPRFRRPRSPVLALRRAAAGLLAVLALALALRPAPAPARAAPDAGTVPVAVAARDLPAGTALRTVDLRVAAVPVRVAPRGRSPDAAPLTGRVLAAPVRAGEPVTDVRLVGAGLTSLLAPGE